MIERNSDKIVKQALSFQTPDKMPVFDGYWGRFVKNWKTKYNQPDNADIEDYYGIDLKVPVANEAFFPTEMKKVGQEGNYIHSNDGWGRIVRTKTGKYFSETVKRIFNSPSDLDKIVFEPAELDIRYNEFMKQVKTHREKGRAVFVKIGGPFIRGSFFRGEEEFLMDMASNEGFAKAQVEKIGEHLLQVGLESLKRAGAYDTGLWIYDDMCSINGPMFSPSTFEKIFLPVYRRMISEIKAAGAKWVILHCDGNLLPFLDMLIDAGIDGINPVEHAAGVDVVKLMEKYGKKLRYIGGVCNTQILTSNDKGRIRNHINELINCGKDGGLVIGTHSIGPDISIENYELYREIVSDFKGDI